MSSQLRSENIVISSYRTRSRGAPLRNSRVWQERARVHGCNSPHRGERWTTRRGERAESAGTALRPRERRLVYKGNSYESMINRPCLPLVFACLYIYIYIYRAVGRALYGRYYFLRYTGRCSNDLANGKKLERTKLGGNRIGRRVLFVRWREREWISISLRRRGE